MNININASYFQNFVNIAYFKESQEILVMEHIESAKKVVLTAYLNTHQIRME